MNGEKGGGREQATKCGVAQIHLAPFIRQDESTAAALRKGEVHRYHREVNGEEGRVEGVRSSSSGGTFET